MYTLCRCVWQDEVGEFCTTVIASWTPPTEDIPTGQVHFEAFQCSKQCVQVSTVSRCVKEGR
jgi:hypothetical protein